MSETAQDGASQDPEDAPASERKAFLQALSSLAWSDGDVDDSELEHIHLAASELAVSLNERDLEARDLQELADKVQHPFLRGRLLEELKTVAQADEHLAPGELATIKFFATAWDREPPEIEGVDWSEVYLPGEADG